MRIEYGATGDRVFLGAPDAGTFLSATATVGRFRHGRPVVDLKLSSYPDRVAHVVLDTGKSGGLSLSSHFWEEVALPGDRTVTREPNRRLCGVSEEYAVVLDWVELAGVRISPAPVRLRIPGTEAARNEDPNDGVLGRAFLKRFDVVLDFSRERVALIRKVKE